MAKRKIYEVDNKERYAMLDEFFGMVAEIKNREQASRFFKDLLTPSESLMLTRRIAIAKLLLEGWTCVEISQKLKVGTNTINYVNRWLYTGFGGYLNELKNSRTIKEFRDKMPVTAWGMLKKKYPAHFLLFNLIDEFKKK
jgi:TrpR-related protein YerC/YecD